jgi:hypothetical protein
VFLRTQKQKRDVVKEKEQTATALPPTPFIPGPLIQPAWNEEDHGANGHNVIDNGPADRDIPMESVEMADPYLDGITEGNTQASEDMAEVRSLLD